MNFMGVFFWVAVGFCAGAYFHARAQVTRLKTDYFTGADLELLGIKVRGAYVVPKKVFCWLQVVGHPPQAIENCWRMVINTGLRAVDYEDDSEQVRQRVTYEHLEDAYLRAMATAQERMDRRNN